MSRSEAPPARSKLMARDHLNSALTMYLRALSVINDDEEVTGGRAAGKFIDVKIEKVKDEEVSA